MESFKIEDINDANSFPVQMTVLNNIVKKQIIAILDQHTEIHVNCYSIPKGSDSNRIYLEKIEKCFEASKNKLETESNKVKDIALAKNKLSQEYERKKIACNNFISEFEIKACVDKEQKNYAHEFGILTKNFLDDIKNK